MAELDNTYGAVFIGAIVSAVLFGVTNLQAFMYFQKYPNDRIWNKLAVCWLWVLDATHLAFCAHMVYWYLITNYFNPLALLEIVWSFKAQIMVDAIVVISVHTLYSVRLWKLNLVDGERSFLRRMLPPVVSAIVFLGYGAAIILCYEITQFNYYTDLLAEKWVTYLPLGAATFVDAVIACSLCFLLARCRTGSASIDSTISLLMVYTLNTGIITSLCSLTAIAAMAALPNRFAVISVEFMLTKLYVNSFMAMFNARSSLRGHDSTTRDSDITMHPLGATPSGSRGEFKLPPLTFTASRSTGRSDLHFSPRSPRAPVEDIDFDERLGVNALHGAHIRQSILAKSDNDFEEYRTVSSIAFSQAPILPRSKPKPAPDSDSSYQELVRTRSKTSRPTAYNAFARRDSSLLGNVDDVWNPETRDALSSTPDSCSGIGVAISEDLKP